MLLTECTKNHPNQDKILLVIWLFSFIIFCLSGSCIFDWLAHSMMTATHELTKSTMHHNIQDGFAKACLIKWLQCHSLLKLSINAIYFYICLVSAVSHFQNLGLKYVFDKRKFLIQGLLTTEETDAKGMLTSKLNLIYVSFDDENEAYLISQVSISSFEQFRVMTILL